jgi:hypothetical protein
MAEDNTADEQDDLVPPPEGEQEMTHEEYSHGIRMLGLMPQLVDMALSQTLLAIDEYYNGDRAWAERWLVRAYEANQKDEDK